MPFEKRRTAKVKLVCTNEACNYQAKRYIVWECGSHGIAELPSDPARCIHGHGPMVRIDGRRTTDDTLAAIECYLTNGLDNSSSKD